MILLFFNVFAMSLSIAKYSGNALSLPTKICKNKEEVLEYLGDYFLPSEAKESFEKRLNLISRYAYKFVKLISVNGTSQRSFFRYDYPIIFSKLNNGSIKISASHVYSYIYVNMDGAKLLTQDQVSYCNDVINQKIAPTIDKEIYKMKKDHDMIR